MMRLSFTNIHPTFKREQGERSEVHCTIFLKYSFHVGRGLCIWVHIYSYTENSLCDSCVPTNDNVVNAFAEAFPQLTSFSATNGVFGENISDAALDALRLSHPGITITIQGM